MLAPFRSQSRPLYPSWSRPDLQQSEHICVVQASSSEVGSGIIGAKCGGFRQEGGEKSHHEPVAIRSDLGGVADVVPIANNGCWPVPADP